MARESLTFEHLAAHEPPGGVDFVQVPQASRADLVVPESTSHNAKDLARGFFVPWAADNYWFLQSEYVAKTPAQQWLIHAGDMTVRAYNYAANYVVPDEEIREIAQGMALFDAHFPLAKSDQPSVLALRNEWPRALAKARQYDALYAMAHPEWKLIEMAISHAAFRGMQYIPELPVSPLRGTAIHELVHFRLDTELAEEWREAGFTWTRQRTQTGRYKHKQGRYLYIADQPEACVSRLGQDADYEDMGDSAVAYLLMPKLLVAAKRRILAAHDVNRPVQQPVVRRQKPRIPKLPTRVRFAVESTSE